MKKANVVIENETGLHARPATELAKLAMKYKCSINLIVNGKLIDARSPLMIMSAGIKHKTELEIICDGENEDLALEDVKSFLKKILKIGGLQKGTPFCEAACCSTFRVFVPFRPVTEGSQRHSALLRGGGPCECPAFPLQIGAQVVIGQRLWRPAEPYPSGLGGRNSLRLTLTDIGTFIFGDKGEYLQHNIAQKRAHQILPLSGIQQRHVQYHNVNAFFFGQYSPLL